MLTALRIRDLAIIEQLDLELGPGLTVVTGETGSGKSLLVTALQLVLGGRGAPHLIRHGAERTEVEAWFDLRGFPELQRELAQEDLDGEQDLVLRRVLSAQGRQRAWVNGRGVPLGQLRQLGQRLVDLSSQHEHHSLTEPATHLACLDAFARAEGQLATMAAAYDEWSAAQQDVQRLEAEVKSRADREDLLRFQIGELERLAPDPRLDAELEAEAQRLRFAERLARSTGDVVQVLYERDRSLCTELGRQAGELAEAARLDPRLAETAQRLDELTAELEELARGLARYQRALVHDPARLALVEERLHQLERLARKYGTSPLNLQERLGENRRQLAQLDAAEADLDLRRAKAEAHLQRARQAAESLSETRRQAAARLGPAITAELAALGMGGAEVRVQLRPLDGPRAGPSRLGQDQAELLIAPNRGELPQPLGRIASGGELARALLAVKQVLAEVVPVALTVFDEIDTGVGGAVADAIGEKVARVARHRQTVCITHLPQVAAWGDHHLRVSKETVNGRTRTRVDTLQPEAAVDELARMLGGREVGAVTRAAAAELRARSRLTPGG